MEIGSSRAGAPISDEVEDVDLDSCLEQSRAGRVVQEDEQVWTTLKLHLSTERP